MRTERIAVSSAISALILLWGSLCSAQVQGQSAQQVLAGLHKAPASGAKSAVVSAGPGKPDKATGVQRLKSPHGLTLRVGTDMIFDADRSTITCEGEKTLTALLADLKNASGRQIAIECFSDGFGFENYTLKLTQQRAEKVRDWFVAHKALTTEQTKAVGLGRRKPLAPESTVEGRDIPEARRANRRLEITVGTELVATKPDAEPPQDTTPATDTGGDQKPMLGPDGNVMEWSSALDPQTPEEALKMQGKSQPPEELSPEAQLINSLPRLEDVNTHNGSNNGEFRSNETTNTDNGEMIKSGPFGGMRAHKPTEQEKEEHEWAVNAFGTWRERD